MMAHLHEDAHRRGEPLAALWAAESAIYPRFGYGLAAPDWTFGIDRSQTGWLEPKPLQGAPRLVSADAARELFAQVYDRELTRRPGMTPQRGVVAGKAL